MVPTCSYAARKENEKNFRIKENTQENLQLSTTNTNIYNEIFGLLA